MEVVALQAAQEIRQLPEQVLRLRRRQYPHDPATRKALFDPALALGRYQLPQLQLLPVRGGGDFDGADPAVWVSDREVIHTGFGVVVVLIDRAAG